MNVARHRRPHVLGLVLAGVALIKGMSASGALAAVMFPGHAIARRIRSAAQVRGLEAQLRVALPIGSRGRHSIRFRIASG